LAGTIDDGNSVEKGEVLRPHCEGSLLWELARPLSDKRVVETNLVLAVLKCSHTNSSVINGEGSDDMIDTYQQAYVTKDDVAFKPAASALYSGLVHNLNIPSRVDNSQTDLRLGQYLATRTVNGFSGVHEWSHSQCFTRLPVISHLSVAIRSSTCNFFAAQVCSKFTTGGHSRLCKQGRCGYQYQSPGRRY
ncbi:hypothetical protein JG688_00016239, partial [Phytophthora aleatoria]